MDLCKYEYTRIYMPRLQAFFFFPPFFPLPFDFFGPFVFPTLVPKATPSPGAQIWPALVASCFRGALLSGFKRAVCFVRAILDSSSVKGVCRCCVILVEL